tara:strand:- start:7833 stop:8843 length:1011 start_codon:yes stop_codon:yes gene_type:complete
MSEELEVNIVKNLQFNPSEIEFVVACSGGNDSIALIELMAEKCEIGSFLVLYNDTGWAREDWPARMERVSKKLKSRGIPFVSTVSVGFEELVKERKGFPMPASAMQFCTQELKTKPTLNFLKKYDPNAQWTIVTGRRREESANRAGLSLIEENTSVYEGRDVFNPLIKHTTEMRDVLIEKFGFEPLPHSSMECFPCVCCGKEDYRMMREYPNVIYRLENLEKELGHTSNGKPRTFARPYKKGGAIGIRQVLEWAEGRRGFKVQFFPDDYKIPGIDYSAYRGGMKKGEREAFWLDIKEQCIKKGYNLRDLPTDIAYDDTTKEGQEFARQCDGGLCGN